VTLDPVAVALKFGFIAVLYLFLLWMARSALKDLRRTSGGDAGYDGRGGAPAYEDATGMHVASQGLSGDGDLGAPRLRVESAAGLRDGVAYDLSDGAVLGRGDQVDIQLEDSFASTNHARLLPQGDVVVLEDLGSTNGTYLNGEPLRGPQPLHAGDRIRIGDSEFTFER
jgi:FHA domain